MGNNKLQKRTRYEISEQDYRQKSIVSAIENKTLKSFLQAATIDDEVQKSNCIYDLVQFDGVRVPDIKAEITDCLVLLNAGLNDKMQLNDGMIKMIVDLVLNDFNGLTIPGFFNCIRKGLKGDYGKVYQMNVMTVTDWIQQYLSSEEYLARVYELRKKHEHEKSEELNKMYVGDMHLVMKEALKMTEKKPKEYVPKQKHLDQFKEVIKLYNDVELDQAIKDWEKRQRPQYLELLNNEKESRKLKKL